MEITGNRKKNFIQLLIDAESSKVETNDDGLNDFTHLNLNKKLTMDVNATDVWVLKYAFFK